MAGGVPRHCHHPGFGVRDLRRFLSGPAYARALAARAVAAGAEIRTEATVTGWEGDTSLTATTPQGLLRVTARAVLLATGARERPRPARLIPGDRPRGVYTTGHLQNLVHLEGGSPGRRAVIVGADPVSWSAALTLRSAGCRPVLLTTEHAKPSYAPLSLPLRVPVARNTRITRINGHDRVTSVDLTDLTTGTPRTIPCDTVILTADWTPDNELARTASLPLAPGSRSPQTDPALRTPRRGVFAAGNVLHPAATASVAAQDGTHAATQLMRWLTNDTKWPTPSLQLLPDPPIHWAFPTLIHPTTTPPPGNHLLLWPTTPIRHLTLRQDNHTLTEHTLRRPAVPGGVLRVPWRLLTGLNPEGGPVRVGSGSTG
ncbi:hypothetical protein SRB5_52300 [Streptomyces sp. RB5]|uniref:FAD/NAD(P)-binding domain-containing protein n=1 Tax=Streptomyces smaragdinus TaxID=2585196 RepID=A0A7K0CP33_9ACTN|nr:hypothetical protein [Streptomyces smaragdinus]